MFFLTNLLRFTFKCHTKLSSQLVTVSNVKNQEEYKFLTILSNFTVFLYQQSQEALMWTDSILFFSHSRCLTTRRLPRKESSPQMRDLNTSRCFICFNLTCAILLSFLYIYTVYLLISLFKNFNVFFTFNLLN